MKNDPFEASTELSRMSKTQGHPEQSRTDEK